MRGLMLNLRKLRRRAGLDQEQLGKRVGVKQATISNFELGKTGPRLATAIRLARVLDVSVETITKALAASRRSRPARRTRRQTGTR